MNRTERNDRITIGVIILAALLGVVAVKILYLGVRETPMGKVGDNRIVFCWTWNSLGSLISNDGREGFYRIYDKDGKKLFEVSRILMLTILLYPALRRSNSSWTYRTACFGLRENKN